MSICRACIKTSPNHIDLETPLELQSSEFLTPASKNFITYGDCFLACTQLELSRYEEHMPQNLCIECSTELSIAYSFLQKALNADRILKNSAARKSTVHLNESDDIEELEVLSSSKEWSIEPEEKSNEEFASIGIFEVKCEDTQLADGAFNFHLSEQHREISEESDHHQKLDITSSRESLQTETDKEFLEYGLDHTVGECSADEQWKDTDYADEDKASFEGHSELAFEITIAEEISDVVEHTNSDDEILFNCPTCQQSFDTEPLLKQHLRMHLSSSDRKKCKICKQHFSTDDDMRKHLLQSHSAVVQCSRCEHRCKEFKLTAHEQRVHAEQQDFICNICNKKFNSNGMLQSHLRYHKRKVTSAKSDACEICSKQFSTQHYLRRHMELHRNERQLYECDLCKKMYFTKTALDNHLRLHSGETIKCNQCGKQFARQYELNVHMRFHTREYPFQCEICDKKFAIKGHLRTHMWRHQGLKLQCEECGKLFTSTKALLEHSFVHTEMPYPCSYCERAYPSKQKFKVHLKASHKIEMTEEELQKTQKHQTPKPLQRKKLTLVQADSIIKEVEVKDDNADADKEASDELLFELCW